jgi:hypothetical protein
MARMTGGGQASGYRNYSAPASKPKAAPMKVSQATIDRIKADGMTNALKKAVSGKASASYIEGVKRMYGTARVTKKATQTEGSYKGSMFVPGKNRKPAGGAGMRGPKVK